VAARGERSRALRRSRALTALALLLGLLVLAGCDIGGDEEPDATAAAGEPMDLDVLVYNVEYSGGPATDAVIRKLDADVVGVLESYERLPVMAKRTGYPYWNTSLQLLSKYPILEPSGGDGLYALLEVEPGYVVPFFNVHLDYVEWGPRALAKGEPVESVLATEDEVRTSALERPIEAMGELLDAGYPVFLTGDFNQPSSLDYTEEAVGTRKEITEPVPWPVSEALFDLGFRDTYREEHPDPVAEPAITQDSSGERIDYVYAAGPSTTLDSKLVGEPGGEDVEIEAAPWTSDHRAVLSTFDVTPAAMPTLIAIDARLADVGDAITVSWNNPEQGENEIAIVPEGGDLADPLETVEAPEERGTAKLDTSAWDPGSYEAVLIGGDDEAEVARVPFYLRDPGAELDISTDRRAYGRGEPIEVSWTGGPANRWDWLGVYEASAADPETDDYLTWDYAEGHSAGTVPPRTAGEAVLGPDSQGNSWPLAPGDYVVHYLLADEYESAGSAEFSVRGGGG
ncbi:MAG TPA: endonuclease/exonuclease/phosphatase family protein, partial [Solirubrobacterales bacterium]|nr:endonuclease/exonuclease/phosphatase family protein [Solirubrobacterales bacterium]